MECNNTLTLTYQENKLLLEAQLGGTKVTFLVDSGANVSVLPHQVAREAGLLCRLQPMEAKLTNPVAEYTPTIHGALQEPLLCGSGLQLRPTLVVMSPAIPILGLDALSSHRCVLTCSRLRPSLRLRLLQPPSPAPFLSTPTYVSCTVMGRPATALLDTGSTCCFMSCARARQLGLEVHPVECRGASTITGTLPILGYTSHTTLTFLGLSASTSFCVNDVEDKLVIGLNVLLDVKVRLRFDAKPRQRVPAAL